MAITRLNKHNSHEVTVRLCLFGPHYAELRCVKCDKHIQWISKKDFLTLTR